MRVLNPGLKAALDHVEEVYGDTTVPLESTIDALEEIQSDVSIKLAALRGVLRRRKRQDEIQQMGCNW